MLYNISREEERREGKTTLPLTFLLLWPDFYCNFQIPTVDGCLEIFFFFSVFVLFHFFSLFQHGISPLGLIEGNANTYDALPLVESMTYNNTHCSLYKPTLRKIFMTNVCTMNMSVKQVKEHYNTSDQPFFSIINSQTVYWNRYLLVRFHCWYHPNGQVSRRSICRIAST